MDRSLEYLRKAMENGYKKINEVYTDQEFATLRTDKRFEELMAQRPQPHSSNQPSARFRRNAGISRSSEL